MLFEKIPELENSEQKNIAFSYYKTLKQTMENYENSKLKEWIQATTEIINKFMKSKLLKVVDTNSKHADYGSLNNIVIHYLSMLSKYPKF